jgi:hypothetical protein
LRDVIERLVESGVKVERAEIVVDEIRPRRPSPSADRRPAGL